MDVYVGGVAKKIEKTYYEMWKTEAAEAQALKDKQTGSSSSSSRAEEKAPELRIGDNNSQTQKRMEQKTEQENNNLHELCAVI